jgi:hypothetical protein
MPVAGCAIQNSFIVMGGPPQNKNQRTRTIKHGWQIKAVNCFVQWIRTGATATWD